MTSNLNRRRFLKRAALAGGALYAAQGLAAPAVLRAASPSDKVRCVLIGFGVRGGDQFGELGRSALSSIAEIVGLVDVDEKRHAAFQQSMTKAKRDGSKVQMFTDYRRMFDKMKNEIDAVFVAAPNHHHALASMMAMQLNKAVYCEKPLCHDIAEARRMAEMSLKSKAATQMGAQGHCDNGYRLLCEYVWSGALGKVTETYSWTNRSNGGKDPRPPVLPVPAGMHWDEWIGPAPFRDYHTDLHPHEFHGWYDFGNGSLGNLACHVMDGPFWSLKVEHPVSVEAEEVFNGTDERTPTGTRIRWDIPARGDMPPVKVYWYDGRNGDDPGDHPGEKGPRKPQFVPPLLDELKKKYPTEKFDSSGTLYVCEKGIFSTDCYGGNPHIVPRAAMKDFPTPPQVLPRPKPSFVDFITAVHEGKTETAIPFSYGAKLTEFILLGNIAQHAGKGHKVEWDGPNRKVTNLTDLNRFIEREYRKGWQV